MTWATHTKLTDKHGTEVQQAAGPACEECWIIGIEILLFQSWLAFVEAHAEGGILAERVAAIRQRMKSKPQASDFAQEEVTNRKGMLARLDRTCIAVFAPELRRKLGRSLRESSQKPGT